MQLSLILLVISLLISSIYASFIGNKHHLAIYEVITSGSISELEKILHNFQGDINEKPFSVEDDVIMLSPLDLAIFSHNTEMMNLIIQKKSPVIDQDTFEMVFRSSCVDCFDVVFDHSEISLSWNLNRNIFEKIIKLSATNDLYFAFVSKFLKRLSFNDKLALIENAFEMWSDYEQISLALEAAILDVTYGNQDDPSSITKSTAVLSFARAIIFKNDIDELFSYVDSLYQNCPETVESKALITEYSKYARIKRGTAVEYLQPEDVLKQDPSALIIRLYDSITSRGARTYGFRVLLKLLKKQQEDRNTEFQDQYEAFLRERDSAMLRSVFNSSTMHLQLLLENGANPNAQDKHGSAAIRSAVNRNSVDSLKLLIKYGADLDVKDGFNYNLLVSAVFRDLSACVQVLLDHTTVPVTLEMIIYAIQRGASLSLNLLLARNASIIDTADEDGVAPLFHAISQRSMPCLRVLLEHGANPNILDNSGMTPLSHGNMYQMEEIVSLLNEYGAVA